MIEIVNVLNHAANTVAKDPTTMDNTIFLATAITATLVGMISLPVISFGSCGKNEAECGGNLICLRNGGDCPEEG